MPKKSKLVSLSLRDKIYAAIGAFAVAGIVAILSALWNFQGRITALETRVDDLRQIVMSKVATETVTVTATQTYYGPFAQFQDTSLSLS
jgi:hypothetical protein